MSSRAGILLVCLTLFGFSCMFAKEGEASFQQTITGSVTSSDGVPLPGVTILVQGTSNGAVTDLREIQLNKENKLEQNPGY